MANPQKENGHIQIATEFWDALNAIKIPGEARQVLGVIIRKTWGWNKKSDQIATSQFVEATKLSRKMIEKARKRLKDMNMITTHLKGGSQVLTYCIQKDYEKWIPTEERNYPPKRGYLPPKKGANYPPKGGTTTYIIDTIQKTVTEQAKPADFSEEFIQRAKVAKTLGFNVYEQTNRYCRGKINRIPEPVMNEILDEFFKHRDSIKEIFPYMSRVIQEKSRRYFSEINVKEHEAIKKGPVMVGDVLRQLAASAA
jgi:phage replication O-like protein O